MYETPGISPAPLPHMFNNQSRYTVRNGLADHVGLVINRTAAHSSEDTALASCGYGLYRITELATVFWGVLYKVQTNVINAV